MNARIAYFRAEHRFYVAAAVGIIVVTLAGFSVDVGLLSDLSKISGLVRVHGLVMLTWVALFFTQALLVARQRIDLHMRLGIFGVGLALIVVIVDSATLVVACRLGGHHMPPGMARSQFLAVGLFNLLTFAILVGTALGLEH